MRNAGILLPLSSLPAPHGIGTLGKAAFHFVDFLAAAGQSLWQLLPIGPTGYGDSPYASFSAFAGNPYFVDLDLLASDGLLDAGEIGTEWGPDAGLVDYGLLYKRRFAVLAKAAARQDKTAPAYLAFCHQNAHWLEDYALYMAIKTAQGGAGLAAWPDALRLRKPPALAAAGRQHAPQLDFWRCVQYFFFRQWNALKHYANCRGVQLVGDIPIYVADDCADLWANPGLFQLGADGRPALVAGVPPDAFSQTGQLWGNPLYDWPAHRRSGYAWWLARLRQAATLFDITRIDHFRGFAGYYAIPAGQQTAENGHWCPGPGIHFIRAVRKALPGLHIIAEDLGFLTQEVFDLLRYSRYPGMKILQFAFDSREESDYLPHNYPRHCVVYTGTHDNTTTEGWRHEARRQDVAFARQYLGVPNNRRLTSGMIRAALASVAETAVIPMQDWLHLGAEARINTPATLGGRNWCWRLAPGHLTDELAAHIRLQTRIFGRLSDPEREKEQYARQLLRQGGPYGQVLKSEASKAAERHQSMAATAGPDAAAVPDTGTPAAVLPPKNTPDDA